MASFRDPFKHVEAKLGGIKLAAAGKMVGNVGAIKGAVFDPDKQCLVLLGDQEIAAPQLKPEDLAIALLCVYGPNPQDPTFSLDPDDPKNPDGPWLKAVYRPYDLTAGTEFGNALFEADWLLKQYSFGIKVDQDGKQTPRKPAIPGFKNSGELSLEERSGKTASEDRARLWIESDDIQMKRSGGGIYFDQVKMRVKAKKQVKDPKSNTGLSDVETSGDFRAVKFANQFTRLYDEIAKESPEFERVRQLAKAVALAKWMKAQGVKVDMAWVAEYANKRVPMVKKAPRLSASYEDRQETPFTQGNRHGVRTSIHTVTISGGVNLKVEPKFIPDDGPALALQQEVKQVLQEKDPPPVFSVKHNGRDFKGCVLPVNQVGQNLWKNYRAGKMDGVSYQFDKQQNVVKSDDKQGNVTIYEYDAQNRLKKVMETRKDGFKVAGTKNGKGSSWSIENPRGHNLQYDYDATGLLKEVQVDGKKAAAFDINEPKRELTVHLKDCRERLVYDDRNNLKEIEFKPTNRDVAASRLSFDYNQAGNLTRIAGTGIAPLQIAYGPDGVKPTRISTPEGNTEYGYYPDGRLKVITDPGGAITRFAYAGQALTNLQLNYKGVLAEYRFTKDGLARSRDLLGGVTEFGYAQGRVVSVKQGQYREAKYTYDDRGRLKEIILPDGSRTEYRYGEDPPRKGKKPEAQMTLAVVNHPAPEPGGVSR
jgi:YD repeat-containing protein